MWSARVARAARVWAARVATAARVGGEEARREKNARRGTKWQTGEEARGRREQARARATSGNGTPFGIGEGEARTSTRASKGDVDSQAERRKVASHMQFSLFVRFCRPPF